jgi:hypothetical protein
MQRQCHVQKGLHQGLGHWESEAESVSTAVGSFIQHKVSQLAEGNKYDDNTRDAVLDYLSLHADGKPPYLACV